MVANAPRYGCIGCIEDMLCHLHIQVLDGSKNKKGNEEYIVAHGKGLLPVFIVYLLIFIYHKWHPECV